MKKFLIFLIVGEKYRRLYDRHSAMFKHYANRCDAKIKLITNAPDSTGKRSLLAQKLLIPDLVKDADIAAFMDLDILIHPDCPSIFDALPPDKNFGAVLDPRGSVEYDRTWGHLAHGKSETTEDYFVKRNFPATKGLIGSINGGVFVFRPNQVANIFKEYYFSDHVQGARESYEEAPMAYLTQTLNCFEAIDARFNTQLIYKLKGTDSGRKIYDSEKKIPSFFRKLIYKFKDYSFIPSLRYEKFVEDQLDTSYIVHFSDRLPMPNEK